MQTPRFLLQLVNLTGAYLLLTAGASAQTSNIVTVPVNYTVHFEQYDSNVINEDFRMQFANDAYLGFGGSPVDTAPRTVQLEVGRRYTLTLEGYGDRWDQENWTWYTDTIDFDFRIRVSTPSNYVAYVEGIAGGYYSSTHGYADVTIVVGPAGGCPQCGPGSDFELTTDETRLAWSVKLGRNANGEVVDPIKLSTYAVTNATFARDELNFTARTSDVQRIPAVGALRQILLPGALLDAVDISGGFELRFYSRDYVTTQNGAGEWQLAGGATPYVTYRWLSGEPWSGSPNLATYTRIATSSEQIVLQRNASTGRWTEVDPTGGYEETTKVSDTVEETRWKTTGGVTEKMITRTYANSVSGQREVVQQVDGVGRTSTWGYYGDTGYPGSKGKMNWGRSPNGNYTIYTYWNEAGPAVGQVSRKYTPYEDLPDGTNHNESVLQTGRWSEFSWAPDINGVGSLLAERIDRVGSTIVGRVTAAHNNGTYVNGMYVLTSTYNTWSSGSSAVNTTRKEYAPYIGTNRMYHGQPYAVIAADRSQASYVQQLGTWNGSSFTPYTWGIDWREVKISGSADSHSGAAQMTSYFSQVIEPIWVMPNRSTLTVRILGDGYPVREELYVCLSGTTFDLASRVDRVFTTTGALIRETRVDPVTGQQVVLYDSNWVNNRLDWERDAQGVKRTFQYDSKGRAWKVTTEGVSGMSNGLQHAQTTTYTYDSADQLKQVEVKGGLNGTLISKTWYDLSGEVTKTEAPGGRQAGYARGLDGSGHWYVTTTFPYTGGATKTVRSYRDGRTLDIFGSAVAGTTAYDYWIDSPAGTETTKVTVTALNSDNVSVTRESRSTSDWAARVASTLGYRADTEAFSRTATFTYHANSGKLTKVETNTGEPRRRFAYDALLGWTAQAVDLNANDAIDYNTTDRVAASESYFEKIGSTWWSIQSSGAYDEEGSSAFNEYGAVETQLNNYSASELSRTKRFDTYGNAMTSTTTFDWTQKQLQTVVDYPTTSNDETTVLRNGRVSSVTTAHGLTFNVKYDEFGRELGRQDPRKGWTNREFVSGSNDVHREQNETDYAASRWTSTYEYDSAGRVKTVTNALSQTARYAYNDRGQLEYHWGSAVTPVRYEYDGFGQRVKMHTYRGGYGWNEAYWPYWPVGSTGTADTTRWVYYDKTGLLQEKRDAGYGGDTSRKVSYTYTMDGLVNTRTWARNITTTYAYNAARELYSKTYNDGGITPSVTFGGYNRRGQLTSVSDYTGTRTYRYDSEGFVREENLPVYFGTRTLGWQRDGYGRRSQLGIHATSNWPNNPPSGDQFLHTYAFESDKGRLSSMSSWSGANANGSWHATSYSYLGNSNHWEWQQHGAWTNHQVHRMLDSNRDTVAYWVHDPTGSKPLETIYTRDTLGRVDSGTRDNTWQPSDWFPIFRGYVSDQHVTFDPTYNDRSELTTEDLKAYVSGNWQNTDLQGGNRLSTFQYDNAQNRELATVLGATDNPSPTNLNQPDTRFGATVTYDKDGNLTSDGTWTYTYDAENRLIQSSKTGTTLNYKYDWMDRRVEARTEYSPGAFFTKRYLWDGWHVIADLWADYGNAVGATYVWGPDLTGTIGGAGGIGGLVTVYYNGRAFLPLQDGQGNIYGYLDTATGKNAAAWDFTPYGETIHERGSVPGIASTWDFPFRYQTKMQDVGSPLLYFGLRYYHPGLGRFINRDPIGEAGGLNLHAYVGNNPGNAWDFLGLWRRWTDPNPHASNPEGGLPVEEEEETVVLPPFTVTTEPFDPVVLRGEWDREEQRQAWEITIHGQTQITSPVNLFADPIGGDNGEAPNNPEKSPQEKRCDDLAVRYGRFLNAESGAFFDTRDDARRAMLINVALGARENWEYGSMVINPGQLAALRGVSYVGPDFFVTPSFSNHMAGLPRTNEEGTAYTSNTGNPWWVASIGEFGPITRSDGLPGNGYPDSAILDSAHSHPRPGERRDERFSGGDIANYTDYGYTGWLVTPTFGVRQYGAPTRYDRSLVPPKDLEDLRTCFGNGRL